jgi:regulator of protease activity HflC (stomatin/prohibitin superfamily)
MNQNPIFSVIGAAIVALFFLFYSGFTIIESGNVGVKIRLGETDPDELEAGWHWVVPGLTKIQPVFTKTIMVNYSSSEGQKPDSEEIIYEGTLNGEDKTGLSLGIDLTVEIQPTGNKMADMYIKVGRSGFEKMVLQAVRSVGRRVISNYSAESIMTMRKQVETDLESELKREFENNEYYKLVNVALKAIVLPSRVREAIEIVALRKQEAAAAEQAIKTRENEAKSVMEIAKGKAEAAKIEARGSAEATLINAEATAKANELLARSLSSNVLTSNWIDAWRQGGSLVPQVLGSQGTGFMLDLSTLEKRAKQSE